MIEGLKFRLDTDELRDYLAARVAHHQEREKFYRQQVDTLKAGADAVEDRAMFTNASNNPIDGLTGKMKEHRVRAQMFEFMRSHLEPNEQYELSEADLQKLEILDKRW